MLHSMHVSVCMLVQTCCDWTIGWPGVRTCGVCVVPYTGGGRGEGGRDKGSSANIDHSQPHQSWKHLAGCDKKRGSWDFGIPGKDIL